MSPTTASAAAWIPARRPSGSSDLPVPVHWVAVRAGADAGLEVTGIRSVLCRSTFSGIGLLEPVGRSPVSDYSSPENRSHADCRVIPRDVPMAAHVAPSALALLTKRARLRSTCAPAAAIRGRLASTPSRSRSSSHDVSPGGNEGGPPMIRRTEIDALVTDVDPWTGHQLRTSCRFQTERAGCVTCSSVTAMRLSLRLLRCCQAIPYNVRDLPDKEGPFECTSVTAGRMQLEVVSPVTCGQTPLPPSPTHDE